VIAGVLPAGKVDAIKQLQHTGRVVAMADAAIEASDLTLVRGDLRAVPDAILLSRRTLATIKGNLFWAFAYNTWRFRSPRWGGCAATARRPAGRGHAADRHGYPGHDPRTAKCKTVAPLSREESADRHRFVGLTGSG
jgi:hypothetical protein